MVLQVHYSHTGEYSTSPSLTPSEGTALLVRGGALEAGTYMRCFQATPWGIRLANASVFVTTTILRG